MKAHIEYWILALVLAIGASLTLKGPARLRARQVLLALVSVFVGTYLVILLGSESRLSRARANIDQAELPLRLEAAVSCGQKHMFSEIASLSQGSTGDRKPEVTLPSAKSSSLDSAKHILETAADGGGGDLINARLAIVLGTIGTQKDRARLATLLEQLSLSKISREQEIGSVLKYIYLGEQFGNGRLSRNADILKRDMPAGWYRDTALCALYKLEGDSADYRKLLEDLDGKYWRLFVRMGYVLAVALFSCLVGVIVILVQLALAPRRKAPVEGVEKTGINVPWKSVYVVFVSWFATELVVGYLLHELMPKIPGSSSEPFIVALITAVSYLLTNVPGLFYIWFFALKPAGLPFWQTLKSRWQTSSASPIKLLFAGYFGWCALFPMVVTAGFIATHFFHSQGSDNPVIAQIVQAAGASNIFATLLFYVTLGVCAPFCEEILFRGFIYQSIKQRSSVQVAVVASALLFALMHFDRGGILPLFTIGLVLALIFERTRSLVPSMVAHGLWNSGTFTFALVLFGTQ